MNRLLKNIVAAGAGLFATIYLLNPDAGWIEFIPDFIPGIGNLDEAAMVLILLRCLAHFGFDFSFLTRGRKNEKPVGPEPSPQTAPPPREPRRSREKVIDV